MMCMQWWRYGAEAIFPKTLVCRPIVAPENLNMDTLSASTHSPPPLKFWFAPKFKKLHGAADDLVWKDVGPNSTSLICGRSRA